MTPATASGVVFMGLHVVLLVAMIASLRWVENQRSMGYPDARARAVDRPAVLAACAAGYMLANLALLVGVAIALDPDLFPRGWVP